VLGPKYTPLGFLIHAWGHEKALKVNVYDYDDDHLSLYSNSDKWIIVELQWIDTSRGKLKVFREKPVWVHICPRKTPHELITGTVAQPHCAVD
jgi:hypothetical protein